MRHAPRGMPCDPDCLASVDRTAKVLGDLGHVVEESSPDVLDEHDSVMHYVTVVAANTARALDAWGGRIGRTLTADDVELTTWSLAERGRATSAADLLATLEFARLRPASPRPGSASTS
jgi:amidase